MTKLLSLLLLLVAAFAFAQESGPAEPQETEIVVPELVLEIEELEVQEISAVLPAEGELALGSIAIPLPGADELFVDEGAFTIPQPGMVVGPEATSVFSSGRLGAGTVNHIVGELSLFKLGADPRFRLRFSHEGLDGYQFGEPGRGYFSNVNVIDGWFAGGSDRMSVDVEAAFSEEVDGLQGRSDYYSVGLRRTTATAGLEFLPDPLVSLLGSVDGSFATRLQSASGTATGSAGTPQVPTEREFALTPGVEARFAIRAVDIVFSTSYFLRFLVDNEIPVSQDIDLLAGVDVDLPASATVAARAGIQWDPSIAGLRYPWSLSVGLLLGEALETNVSGGYRVDRLLLADIWTDVPLAAVGDADGDPNLVNDGQWYADVSARWSGASGLSLTAGAEFIAHEAVVDLRPYRTDSDEFPFVQRAMLSLQTSARASWRPGPQMQVQAGATGVFIDAVTGQPRFSVDGSIRAADRAERFTGAAEVRSDFYNAGPAMPWVGLSGSFAPSDELEFTLEFSDLLSPLLSAGRPTIGPATTPDFPFIEPGFRASLFTRISL